MAILLSGIWVEQPRTKRMERSPTSVVTEIRERAVELCPVEVIWVVLQAEHPLIMCPQSGAKKGILKRATGLKTAS